MDSKDRKLCLNREEVKDLGNGLLIGAVSKHNAVKASARHQLTHLGAQQKQAQLSNETCVMFVKVCRLSYLRNYRLRVSLVHPQYYNGDVEWVFRAPRWTELLVGNMARLPHDYTHTETWGLLGSHWHHHLGE